MPGGITCRIEECNHNETGKCLANKIEVRSSVDNRVCNMSENTCCETFEPRMT